MNKKPEPETLSNVEEHPLAIFEKTLSEEEAELIHSYVTNPTPEILSSSFDLIIKKK